MNYGRNIPGPGV